MRKSLGVTMLLGFMCVVPASARADVYYVNTTADTGVGTCAALLGLGVGPECTLREAINSANAHVGPDEIRFNISTSECSGQDWCTIKLLLGSLPELVDDGTRILGFTQPACGAGGNIGSNEKPGVLDSGNNCPLTTFKMPEVAIDGNGFDAITIGTDAPPDPASDIYIEGLAIYNTTQRAIYNRQGLRNVARKMVIGALPDGSDPDPLNLLPHPGRNKGFGVLVGGGEALGSIGSEFTIESSYVAWNGRGGIAGDRNLSKLFARNNESYANGWADAAQDGIDLNGTGGEARCNLSHENTNVTAMPSGGGGNGIELGSQNPGTGFNLIEYNTVRGNLSAGISARAGSSGNTVRKNVVSENEVGISVNWEVVGATNRNKLSQNSTFKNIGLGIDLQLPGLVQWTGPANSPTGPDGVTPNDHCDADEGSNDVQNFPELISAITIGSQSQIEGKLDSTADTRFLIEFFMSPEDDLFGDREGKKYIGSAMTTTGGPGSCEGTFTCTNCAGVPKDYVITATATKYTDATTPWSTSEYSGPITADQLPRCARATGSGWYRHEGYCQHGDDDRDKDDKASFGFSARYDGTSNNTPTGGTSFKYSRGDVRFESTSYVPLSLVVTEPSPGVKKARWRGIGKLNGEKTPSYCFKANVTDTNGGADTWRIRIWPKSTSGGSCSGPGDGTAIYDNGSDASESSLGGGRIEIGMNECHPVDDGHGGHTCRDHD